MMQAPIQKVVDARDLFLEPGRKKRPERICIILRGLPGERPWPKTLAEEAMVVRRCCRRVCVQGAASRTWRS